MRLVVLVPPGTDREGAGAGAWARARGYGVREESLGSPFLATLEPDDVLWCHAGDAVPALPDAARLALGGWVAGGGRLLLSLLATPLAGALGAPDESPTVQRPVPWRDDDDSLWSAGFRDWPDYPHIRGAQGWGEHPLFDGLQRGSFTWRATEGEPVARTCFRAPHWPSGRVLAVDRGYVQLDADTAVAWEYDVGAGRILCLGANVSFGAGDASLQLQRDRYLANAFAYLDPRRALRGVACRAWPRRGTAATRPVPDGARSASPAPHLPHRARTRPLRLAATLPVGELQLSGEARADAPFTIASPRALVVGDEATGVRECWVHPLCVLSEGLRLTVGEAPLRATTVRVTPGLVERHLVDVHGGTWREVVAASPDHAAIIHEIAPVDAGSHASIRLEAALRLRLQWPFAGDALHPLATALLHPGDGARDAAVVTVSGSDGAIAAGYVVEGAAELSLDTASVAPQLTASSIAGSALRLAMVATTEGAVALATSWRSLTGASPPREGESLAMADVAASLARRDGARRAATPGIVTPAHDFDVAWEWAKARLASFMVHVPHVGTGLVAGYAASRPGWGDSRPGYAWCFGRDACWCGDALLAAGMFDEARAAMEFLAATADVTGKIAHEITTSGVAHYDAADSTPLWLRFVAQYADWTGDLATVRGVWDAVRAAVAFVLTHDRDGDGLPENTGVGHGWVESGPLGGGAVTSYVAAIWIDALRRLEPLARAVGDAELAVRAAGACTRATAAVDARLRDPLGGMVALQLGADGRPSYDLTALSAVPILLGVDEGPTADVVNARLASDDFSAPWGVRMIGHRDARYRPRGYHFGAVWPLYTGWASLAAFARARPDEGWQHLAAVSACAFARERGAFDEVLDGDTGAAAGICPDQAWSAAMVISPFIYGMLGIRPTAAARRVIIDPLLPSAWTKARVAGLRIGSSRLSLTVTRAEDVAGGAAYRGELQLESGPALTLHVGTEGEGGGVVLQAGTPVTVTWPARRGRGHGER